MSDEGDPRIAALQRRALRRYTTAVLLLLLGIALLLAYASRLGPLNDPNAERSFGLAVSGMAILGAVIFHLADRAYRIWPIGPRGRPTPPAPMTMESWARLLKVLIVVIAIAGIAYIIGILVV